MLTSYFQTKNYSALYATVFLNKIGDSAFSFFLGSYLYSIGMPLHFIILFFGCEFGLRGLLSPFGAMLVSRLGTPCTLLLASLFSSAFFISIALADGHLLLSFCSLIFYSVSRSIYYPCKHALNGTLISNEHRGKQMSLELVITSLGAVIGTGFGGSLISHFSFMYVAIIASFFVIISALPFFFILEREHTNTPLVSFIEPYKFILSEDFRSNIILLFGQSFTIINRVITAPLFLFLIIKKFDVLGILFAVTILIETIVTLYHGRYIDNNGNKIAIIRSSNILMFVYVIYSMLAHNFITSLVSQLALQVSNNMFSSSLETSIHRKIGESKKPLIFASSKEMTLCFSEFLQLSFFAIVAFLIGQNVFYVMFAGGVLGLLLIRKNI